MSGQLEKTVLITGASAGIGRATAIYMAERGFSVIGTSRSLDRLESLKDEATRSDLSIAVVELDPNGDEAVDSVLPDLISQHGGPMTGSIFPWRANSVKS